MARMYSGTALLNTLRKSLCTYGTASAVPYKATAMRALAPEVRLFRMPDEPLDARKGVEVLVLTKKFAGNHWKDVPQGLKPSPIAYSMARLTPCPS
jgi:hypothetical protein